MLFRIIFTIALVLIIIAAFVLILFTPIKRYFQSRFMLHTIARKLYKIAIDNDYLLINNYEFQLDKKAQGKFDHILFGDKFFYCIVDKGYTGGISGNLDDENWTYYDTSKNGKCIYIRNTIKTNHNRTKKFSLVTGLDRADLISIALVNDSCLLAESIISNSDHEYIIHVSELPKLIKEIESRDIGKIAEEDIEKVVQQRIMRTNRYEKAKKQRNKNKNKE